MSITYLPTSSNLYFIFLQDFNKNNMDNTLEEYAKLVQNNVAHLVDSYDHTDKWMCVNKDFLYHKKTEDIFLSTKNVDDKDVVYDDKV